MTALPFDAMIVPLTEEDALEESLAVAESLGLPVTTWVEGDVTLTILEILSYWVAKERGLSRVAIAGGLIDFAEDDEWLTAWAKQVYDVDRIDQDFARTTVTVTNTGQDTHVVGANDLTFQNASTDKTYRNVSPAVGTISIAPGDVVSVDIIADEAGSASSADPGDISIVVSGFLGLTVTNPSPAVGRDRETGDQLKARCRLKTPAISKTGAGPKGKYAYIAITPEENGNAGVTRCDVRGNSVTGAVTVVLAGSSGAVTNTDRDLVEEALVDKVIGPTETLTVISATNASIDVTYELWVYDDVNVDGAALQAKVSQRIDALFALAPIGGWRRAADPNGKVFVNLLEATIKSVTNRAFQVAVTLPAADVDLTQNQVPVKGTVTGTIHLEVAPPTGGTL